MGVIVGILIVAMLVGVSIVAMVNSIWWLLAIVVIVMASLVIYGLRFGFNDITFS